MKALSIRQPWANLIAAGVKTIETRTWETKYRGPLLICSGKTVSDEGYAMALKRGVRIPNFPLGHAIAIVELYDIKTMAAEHEKSAFVPARPGLFAWYLRAPELVRSFEVKGKLQLFEVPDHKIERLEDIAEMNLFTKELEGMTAEEAAREIDRRAG